jgi:hypothetical protein
MVKGVIPAAKEDGPRREMDLSCTFCGPGTWAMWDVVTDDGVSFACDWHHAEMSQSKIIRLERMRGKETWNKVPGVKDMFYAEEYLDDLKDYE